MVKTICITDLMKAVGINNSGQIQVTEYMSELEPNPKDDWLFYSLQALKAVSEQKRQTLRNAAFIGSGNGIETIVAIHIFPELREIYVTDILPGILPQIADNIRNNLQERLRGKNITFYAGRDCNSLEGKVDLIYANLPLVTIDSNEINSPLATTTLTDASAYKGLACGTDDPLRKYSLLSQLGFLLSAKEKLKEDGTIITMIGGRIPYYVIEECFDKAGLKCRKIITGFKRQSDPQFLEQYAALEAKEGITFDFYDYGKAARIIKKETGFDAPGEIKGYDDQQLKKILAPARLNAKQAFEYYNRGKDVGHIAYGFVAHKPRAGNHAAA